MVDRNPGTLGADPRDAPSPDASMGARTATVHVQDPRGGERTIETRGEQTLMELLRDRGMSIMALCGGGMSCGTCHVHLPPPWADRIAAASMDEVAILEGCQDYSPGLSRLSCQVRLDPALDGVRLTVIGE